MAKKFYTVKVGRTPGVYETWAECESQVKQFPGAKFKSFLTRSEAERALAQGWETGVGKGIAVKPHKFAQTDNYIKNSLSVDAACSGNPGEMEYQCVDTDTGEQIFASKLYPHGTNNIGEFLAIVDALRYLHEKGDKSTPVYSDSVSAIAWVRNERVKTNLYRTEKTEELFKDIEKAIAWLNARHYENPVLKWETKEWGESKADFGRK